MFVIARYRELAPRDARHSGKESDAQASPHRAAHEETDVKRYASGWQRATRFDPGGATGAVVTQSKTTRLI